MCLEALQPPPVLGISLGPGLHPSPVVRFCSQSKRHPVASLSLGWDGAVSFGGDVRKKKLCTLLLVFPPHPPPPLPGAGSQSGPDCRPFPAGPAIPEPAPARPRHPGIPSPGLTLNRETLDAQANLGVLLFFQGDYVKAEPHLRAALDMQPNLTKIQALLGMAEKRTGETANARTHLEASFAAVDEPKLKVQIGMELVELYTASQDLEKASSVVNAMRQADPANPAVLYAGLSRLFRPCRRSHAEPGTGRSRFCADASGHGPRRGQAGQQRRRPRAIPESPRNRPKTSRASTLRWESCWAFLRMPKTKAAAESEYKAAIAENALDEKAETRLGDLSSRKGDSAQALEYYTHRPSLAARRCGGRLRIGQNPDRHERASQGIARARARGTAGTRPTPPPTSASAPSIVRWGAPPTHNTRWRSTRDTS